MIVYKKEKKRITRDSQHRSHSTVLWCFIAGLTGFSTDFGVTIYCTYSRIAAEINLNPNLHQRTGGMKRNVQNTEGKWR